MKNASWIMAVLLAAGSPLLAAAPASGQQSDPDWPCVQPKVPELSVASVWSGPDVDVANSKWREDKEVSELAAQLASRRVPVEDAVVNIETFADRLKPDEKSKRLTDLFTGVFVTLNQERDEIMNGIDRYGRAQKAMAERIRADQSRLSDLNSGGKDPQQARALTDQVATAVRVFNDRRSSLTYVCEVPTIIEQRLFAIARAIQSAISG
jgi:hypothetical protein